MWDRGLREIHAHQILLGRFDSLADRLGNFLRLPRAISDHGGAGISHHHQRGKGEILTSFDNLGDTIDRDYLILKLVRTSIELFCDYWHPYKKARCWSFFVTIGILTLVSFKSAE